MAHAFLKSVWKFCLVLLVVLGLAQGCKNGSKFEAESVLRVGAASAVINPEVGMFIAGDRPNRRFTGVHDDIFAKAVYVEQDQQALALVTLDCIGLLYPDVQKIRKTAAALVGDPRLTADRIIISSNHIHSGPDVVGIWGPSQGESGVDSTYMASLVSIAAEQVKKAFESKRVVTAHHASGEFGEEWVHNICEPEEIDRSLTVMQFLDPDGNSIASLTNFACHPTFFDAVHDEVSGDYVGAFYAEMSRDIPGEHLFLQGAIGGWVQPDKGDQSYATGTQRGRELAAAVSSLLASRSVLEAAGIDFRNTVFELPVSNPGWSQLAALGVINREISATTTTEIAWFRIGEAQFITHPGETPPAYSLISKEWMDTGPRFVLGLGLDAMGYILKPSYFEPSASMPHAEYLTRMSAGAEAGPLVLEKIRDVIPQK